MFTNKKREGINRFVCDLSLYVAETPKASIKYRKPLLPIIPFGIVAYGFVGQPFSKQLYINSCFKFQRLLLKMCVAVHTKRQVLIKKTSLFPLETVKQNSLFPLGPVSKCLILAAFTSRLLITVVAGIIIVSSSLFALTIVREFTPR